MKKSTLYYSILSTIFALVFQLPTSHGQTFSASSEGINSGNEVCIDVSVADFSNIIGMQWSMNYDNSLLTYSGVTNLSALSLNAANFGNVSDLGAVTFSWVQSNLQGQTLNDGEIIFSVCFFANSAVNITSDFTFSGNPTAIEIIDANDQILDADFNNGSITISSMDGGLQLLSSSLTPDFCENNSGGIDVTLAGGTAPFSFNWTGVNSFASSEEDISGLTAGNYILEVEDAAGNTLTATFLVEAQELEITGGSAYEIGCDGTAEIDITTNGLNPTFAWSTGETTEDIVAPAAGTYSVTVTDGNCMATQTFQVEPATGLAAATYNCTYFNPDLTEVEIIALLWCGGTPPYAFTWSDGTVETTDQNVSSITVTNPTGPYSVTITDDFGFQYVLEDIVTDCNFPPVITGTVTDVNCTDQTEGSIDIDVTGGSQDYTYSWSNGETTQDISGLPSGSYSVTVTDAVSGASTTEDFFVAGNLFLAYSYECQFPLSTTISAIAWAGVGPVTYEWSNGFTETLDNPDGINLSSITVPLESEPISFTVTATDATGCSETIITDVDCTTNNPTDVFLSISPEQSNIQQGESTCVDVVVGNFQDILSMQFSMEWDASLVNFDEVTNFNLPGLTASNFGEPGNNQLTFSWYDPDLSGESLPDNSPIFTLCYTALNTAGTATIEITETPTAVEIFNINDEELNLQTSSGIINIGGGSGNDGTVYGTTATSAQGETACVEIRAIDIIGLSGMQFSMNWDPDALNFLGVENFVFDDQTSIQQTFSPFDEAAESGELRFLFLSNDFFSGESFLDDTPLFELCFEVLSIAGVESVDITNTPIEIEFIDIYSSTMNVSTSGGEIIIIDPLWPGDTDNNGIVNQYDLLNLGLAYGAEGPARTISTDWTPFYLEDWGENTPTSAIDFKHIDTDGNGQINSLDTMAIAQNWGLTTDFWDEEEEIEFQDPSPQNNLTINAPFYIQSDTVAVEETISLDIILGDEANPVIDMYGIAFTITFDPEVVVPGSVHADFENSWLGTLDQNMIAIYKEDYEVGKLHVAVTRIDGQEISGNGKFGEMNITIKDVIFREPLEAVIFGIEGVKMINVSEQEIQVEPVPTVSYIDTTTDTFAPDTAHKVKVFPSPASDKVFITAIDLEIISFEIYTPNGERVKKIEHTNEVSVKALPSGIYLLKIISNEGLILKRFSKI